MRWLTLLLLVVSVTGSPVTDVDEPTECPVPVFLYAETVNETLVEHYACLTDDGFRRLT